MLFNSYEFIFLFFPVLLFIYFTLNKYRKEKLAKTLLVLGSLYFYAYFNYTYIFIIVISIIVNYFIGNVLHKEDKSRRYRRLYLFIGVIFNISLLGYFKYYNFFIDNINMLLGTGFKVIQIMLPLGISFFTFQQLSFIIDSYNKKSYKYDFFSYCLFVTFFPQLIAGPIVLPEEMLPQFEDTKNKCINYSNMNKGLYIFSIGLFKKVVIADAIAVFANVGFDIMTNLTFIEAWISSLAYTFQLYFDFSGYCDMAIGIALMFNIILPINFDSPYKSKSIQEFWRRWHITLGRFLTNYIYIPLGGNRNGEKKTLRNLMIVFLVSGIWHGAGWTFIIWGLLHGISILVHRLWKNSGNKLNALLGWFLTFNIVNIFWVFFRSIDLSTAINILKSMFGFRNLNPLISSQYISSLNSGLVSSKLSIVILIISVIICFLSENSNKKRERFELNIYNSIEIIMYISISIIFLDGNSTFLYFNF